MVQQQKQQQQCILKNIFFALLALDRIPKIKANKLPLMLHANVELAAAPQYKTIRL